MKIISVITQLEAGGAQTVAVDLHREFLRRGHESRLLFLYEKDSAVFPQRDYKCMLNHSVRSPLDYLTILARLRRDWVQFKPDAVIAHTHFSNNIAAIMRMCGARGRVIPVHHNVYESYPSASRKMDNLARYIRSYDREVAVSDPVMISLKKAVPNVNAVTIPNGVDIKPLTLDRAAARDVFGLPRNDFLIGNIGRLVEQKNQKFLVRILQHMQGTRLAILGEGPLRDELVAEAYKLGVTDRLHLIGSVVHERVPDFLAALDVFAMPSLFEGLSIAMLEAFGAGIPFIGSEIPSIATVTADRAGVVLPFEPTLWIAELTHIRDDRAYAQSLSEKQKERAKDFTLASMADNYLSIAAGDTK